MGISASHNSWIFMNNNGKGSWLENRDTEIHNTHCMRGRNSHKTKKKQHLCFRCLLWARGQDLSLHVSHPHLPSHCSLRSNSTFSHQLFHPSSGWTHSTLRHLNQKQDPWKRSKWKIISEYSKIPRSSVTMWQRIRYECWNYLTLDLRICSDTNYILSCKIGTVISKEFL